jgi:hypothetical protein
VSYPFVAAYWDNYGPRKGPTLGIGLHMAEGGGTVGYLDKIGTIPPRGVSVHAVCDRAGVVTQMLKWGDASGSLNPANRSTEKGYYGHSVLVAVLGDWWTDPNSAIVSMEIEGMAATGPNALQVPAVIAWGLDMRRMFPTIRGAFGHADQTDTKGCPGTTDAMKAIFTGIGGHGLFATPPETSTGEDMAGLKFDIVAEESGWLTVEQDGSWAVLVDGSGHVVFNRGDRKRYVLRVRLAANYGTAPNTQDGFLVGSTAAVMFARNVTPAPDAPPVSARDAANAALDKVASFALAQKG